MTIPKVLPWNPHIAAPRLADMSYRTELAAGNMDPAHQEFEPDLRTATLGTRIHIVVNVKTQLQPDLWLVQMALLRQLLLLQATLDYGTWTLLNAVVSTKDPSRPQVTLDDTSTAFLRNLPLLTTSSWWNFAAALDLAPRERMQPVSKPFSRWTTNQHH